MTILARDRMFKATNTIWARCNVVPSDHKRRARLNIISDLLSKILHKVSPCEKPVGRCRFQYRAPMKVLWVAVG
jgi:hypothetical protein